MNRNAILMTSICSATLLAACGGGGNDTPPPTFSEMSIAADALEADYLADMARTDIPNAGAATYEGFVGGDLSDGRDLIGELTLTVDFATTDVGGSANNFADETDQAFVGTLTFTGEVIYGATTTDPDSLEGFLEGDLTANGTTYNTSLLLDSSEFFRGVGAETPTAIAGSADGLLDDGGLGLLLDGDFIAEKQ